jgi:hypothetical protein
MQQNLTESHITQRFFIVYYYKLWGLASLGRIALKFANLRACRLNLADISVSGYPNQNL